MYPCLHIKSTSVCHGRRACPWHHETSSTSSTLVKREIHAESLQFRPPSEVILRQVFTASFSCHSHHLPKWQPHSLLIGKTGRKVPKVDAIDSPSVESPPLKVAKLCRELGWLKNGLNPLGMDPQVPKNWKMLVGSSPPPTHPGFQWQILFLCWDALQMSHNSGGDSCWVGGSKIYWEDPLPK